MEPTDPNPGFEALLHDGLVPFFSPTHPLAREVRDKVLRDGYCVLPGVLSKEEVVEELDRLWAFVEAKSPGVKRGDSATWYPAPAPGEEASSPPVAGPSPSSGPESGGPGQSSAQEPGKKSRGSKKVGGGKPPPPPPIADPWPHSGWKSFTDMLQMREAGWVFGGLREKLASRVFEPLFGTRELHCSKEGFTFLRPTACGRHPALDKGRPGHMAKASVCGKPAGPRHRGEHFDQRAGVTGLRCVQSSTALTDQLEGDG